MLQIAIQLDPDYSDAMAYMNLLYRIEAGIADTAAQSAEYVAKADNWVTQALDAKRRLAQNPRPADGPLDVDGPAIVPIMAPPPPPPPPPPLPPGASQARMEAPGAIRVSGETQQTRLMRQVPPVYPPAARQAGTSGLVRLGVIITKEGRVRDITVMTGPGRELEVAAMQAVSQWAYKPTLLNGEPVEVVTTVEVNFAAGAQ
jgi:TonB family protein